MGPIELLESRTMCSASATYTADVRTYQSELKRVQVGESLWAHATASSAPLFAADLKRVHASKADAAQAKVLRADINAQFKLLNTALKAQLTPLNAKVNLVNGLFRKSAHNDAAAYNELYVECRNLATLNSNVPYYVNQASAALVQKVTADVQALAALHPEDAKLQSDAAGAVGLLGVAADRFDAEVGKLHDATGAVNTDTFVF